MSSSPSRSELGQSLADEAWERLRPLIEPIGQPSSPSDEQALTEAWLNAGAHELDAYFHSIAFTNPDRLSTYAKKLAYDERSRRPVLPVLPKLLDNQKEAVELVNELLNEKKLNTAWALKILSNWSFLEAIEAALEIWKVNPRVEKINLSREAIDAVSLAEMCGADNQARVN